MTEPETDAVDVEAAIKAETDRLNVDHRTAAEAITTYYATLRRGGIDTDPALHLALQYQLWLLSDDEEEG